MATPTLTQASAFTQVKNLPFINAAEYNFSWTNGSGVTGNLSAAGAGKILTFAFLPSGLVVSNSVYLTGGTGTAESVLITATTGTAGAPGTITVTTANVHGGAWQVQSASSGIQEAVVSGVDGSTVFIPPGHSFVYASINVNKSISFLGSNTNTQLLGVPHNLRFFNCLNSYCSWTGIFFADATGDQTAGGSAIYLDSATDNQLALISGCYFSRLYDCVVGVKAVTFTVQNCAFDSFLHNGVTAGDATTPDGDGPFILNNQFFKSNPSPVANAAIEIQSTGAVRIIGNAIGNAINYGILISATTSSGCIIQGNDIENLQTYSIFLQGSYSRVVISGNTISQFTGIGDPSSWDGILCSGGIIASLVVVGNAIQGSGGAGNIGVNLQGTVSRCVVSNNLITDCFYGIFTGTTTTTAAIGTNNIINCNISMAANSASVVFGLTCNVNFALASSLVCSDGSVLYVTDGKVTSGADNTLTSGGTGALAIRVNGVWRAFATQN
jgi:hypothetical protein